MSSDLIILAMKKAVEANKRNIQYIKGILNNWYKKGIKTVVEAQKEDEQFKKKTNQKNKRTENEQRKYPEGFLDSFYTNLKTGGAKDNIDATRK